MTAVGALLRRAESGEPHILGRLISMLEDKHVAPQRDREELLAAIDLLEQTGRQSGPIVGITGAPGCGKSTLVAALTTHLLDQEQDLTIGVVAVDPSSALTGGSLLGDRTRLGDNGADRRFFRSQSSAGLLGGLAVSTFEVCRLLRLYYDLVLVETVGTGQSELDVWHLADRLFLVLAPLAGDELQYLKAGIMELPDELVLNKVDEPSAAATAARLRASLSLETDREPRALHLTSARDGTGIADLADAVLVARPRTPEQGRARDSHFLRRWVEREWGSVGLEFLDSGLDAQNRLSCASGIAEARRKFDADLRAALRNGLAEPNVGR